METPLSDTIAQTSALLRLCSDSLTQLRDKFPAAQARTATSTVLPLFSERLAQAEQRLARDASNVQMGSLVISSAQRYLQELYAVIVPRLAKPKLSDQALANIVFTLAKVETLGEVLSAALSVPEDDLLALPRTHARWVRVLEVVTEVPCENSEKLAKSIKDLERKVMLASAFISNGLGFKAKYAPELMVGLGTVFYGLSDKKAETQAKLNYASPTIEGAVLVWNMVDSRLLAPIYELVVQDVELNKVVSVPRTMPPILPSAQCMYLGNVPLRVLSPFRVPKLQRSFFGSSWLACCSRDKPAVLHCDRLIFHIHGGGFISMTSHSHQNYTRKWALHAHCPVVSVDYRLAPEAPYPAALDDVWQVYMWLRRSSAEELGIKPNKIVIAGDSAGGNLAMGLVMKTLEEGLQPPDGLLLPYPALNLSFQRFTPSQLLALDDMILHHTFLKLCLKSYVAENGANPETDPYLSPLLISDEILRKFPPVRLIVGTKDPLHDDCWRLAERLHDLGVNVKMSVFEGFIHGGLNYAVKNGLEEAEQMVRCGAEYLIELFS